ncbi:MAG TPA: peptidylprolyl isomerase [Acidimicrobiales bacterium]|nr:peptidylprolyl isomerase [Acidimicrobiales bacterium]
MNQEKRQRQKAGRQARLEAEQKVRKRKQNIRRVITVAIVAVIVIGLSYLIFKPSGSKSATTTTTAAASTTTRPPPSGGSGNTSPSAITTSADCPANFSATLNKPTFSAPPMTIDPSKSYTATVTTDLGPFTIQLDPKTAPKATNSFVYLADKHFFDCIVFHRVIQTFMNQTGDPTGTGSGGPGYQFTEAGPGTANPQYPIGSVAMANSNNPATTNPTTNGSQFFIVTGPEGESLAPDYTLFGKVTSGMDVLDKINADGSASTSQTGAPAKTHRMVSVTISVS